jgi:hypothetical protein
VVVISLIGQMGEGAMSEATEQEKKAAEEKRKREAAEARRKQAGPLSIEVVLAEEAAAIHGNDELATTLLVDLVDAQEDTAKKAAEAKEAKAKEAKAKGVKAKEAKAEGANAEDADAEDAKAKDAHHIDADERPGNELPKNEVKARKALYRELNKQNHAAICCSGGGIRSATFCLGVVQALAGYAYDAESKKWTSERTSENSLLGRFHYLSTVSGGGYFGSWLSSWRKREDFADILDNLTGRPSGPDVEPAEISWLRAYSNYLTPTLGIASADSWAAVAIVVRNLVLNWLIIIPIICLAVLALKLIATLSTWVAHGGHGDPYKDWLIIALLAIGMICLMRAQSYTIRHRPTRRPKIKPASNAKVPKTPAQDENIYEGDFLRHDFIWAALSAAAVTIFFSSRYFASRFGVNCPIPTIMEWGGWHISVKVALPVITAVAAVPVYMFGWLFGQTALRSAQDWRDFLSWGASGLVYGGLVGLGAYLFLLLRPYSGASCTPTLNAHWYVLLPIIFGVPWVLMAQLTADNIFGGLVSYQPDSDSDREWLGRAAGWLAAIAIAWALIAFLVFAGGYAVLDGEFALRKYVVASGGVAGVISAIVTALLGKSSLTPATSSSKDQSTFSALAAKIGLAVAGPVFAALLIIAISVVIDQLLLGDSLVKLLQNGKLSPPWILLWLGIGTVIAAAIGLLASYCVNINRFSMHALYRNRLIRAYLGASRQKRQPDRFTGFDVDDNVPMHELWPPKSNPGRLFHVVNIALNVVSTKRLAWQERKAEPFTVSPKHCGNAYLGFRRSEEYGDSVHNKNGKGITLGTAVAISGAAASPNMGYNSSPSITLLMALFNVRLGWWLGNPGPPGDDDIRLSLCKPAPADDKYKVYRSEGPTWAAVPLLYEAFGQTTDERRYVYLSDGGHFEDLALYEMVRRRCRFIVVVDAGEDAKFAFEDLGNAVRKIYIDLGIRITFDKLDGLQSRPSPHHPLSGAVLDAAAKVNMEVAKVATAAALAAQAMAQGGAAAARPDEAKPKVDVKEGETPEPGEIPYYALGTIHYVDADGEDADKRYGNGTILYVKPAYHGTETSAGIRSYAMANSDFPHETTVDQWFTESQFESYRSLALDIVHDTLHWQRQDVQDVLRDFLNPPAKNA